jgi:hypothetical protein
MATSLADIRAKLKAQQDKLSGGQKNSDTILFGHWNIQEGDTASVRFLPDADKSNDFFWVERLQIKLPFAGIKGKSDKPVVVTVPCVEMWGESCPILAEVRTWFKDKSLEEMGRKYWKKRSYILQGFVRENPIKDDSPENPIRKFLLTPELFKLVREGIMNPEIEEIPTHFEQGLDFRIKKGTKGGYADYSTSNWARRESALTSEEHEAIEKHGLFDLKTFLPKKPGEVEMQVMREMFEASVNGEQYDLERWGQYFKPFGMKDDTSDTSGAEGYASNNQAENHKSEVPVTIIPARKTLVMDNADDAVETKTLVEASSNSQKAQDILAAIRNRKKD